MERQTPFRRDPEHKLLAGICGALAERIGVEATWLRLALALIAVCTGGVVVWAYAILWAITPLGTAHKTPLSRFLERAGRLFRSRPFEYPEGPDHV